MEAREIEEWLKERIKISYLNVMFLPRELALLPSPVFLARATFCGITCRIAYSDRDLLSGCEDPTGISQYWAFLTVQTCRLRIGRHGVRRLMGLG